MATSFSQLALLVCHRESRSARTVDSDEVCTDDVPEELDEDDEDDTLGAEILGSGAGRALVVGRLDTVAGEALVVGRLCTVAGEALVVGRPGAVAGVGTDPM